MAGNGTKTTTYLYSYFTKLVHFSIIFAASRMWLIAQNFIVGFAFTGPVWHFNCWHLTRLASWLLLRGWNGNVYRVLDDR